MVGPALERSVVSSLGLALSSRRLAWVGLIGLACNCNGPPAATPRAPYNGSAANADATPPFEVVEVIYDGGFKEEWHGSGTAAVEVTPNGPARVRFNNDGEWSVSKSSRGGTVGGIAFRIQTPPGEGEFLEVRVDSAGAKTPRVKLSPDHRTDLGDGWTQVVIPMEQLDPEGLPFSRVVFRPFRPLPDDWVLFDKISVTRGQRVAVAPTLARPGASGEPARGKPVPMTIACEGKATKISRFIYGVAGADADHMPVDLGVTVYRWGGNPASRYNWESHVNNSASDWFFENHSSSAHEQFLAANASRGAPTALTVPMIGWVAKDASSYSFPVSVFGPQGKTDPWKADAGNGTKPAGGNIPPGPPTRTSVPAPPDWVKRWVASIRSDDAKTGKHSIYEYILDNEPMLWNTTHRDVRPDPLGYDELVDRTIQYATAIREADPDAPIAGPAEWGWTNYFSSAKDVAAGAPTNADRRAHQDVPLVEWYLRKLREYEQKKGIRLLDVLDMHYYPQAENVYSSASDATTAALRLRSTRSLWDPSYTDESWIHEPVRLLPRMKEWVDKNYPGRGISIGEWNFGGEKDMSGALATAEALGRFAQFGVTSAFYWTVPPQGSPSLQGFLAYRNFDGKGGHFLDWYLPTKAERASLFASRDEAGRHIVAVAINMSSADAQTAQFDLTTCAPVANRTAYVYAYGDAGFTATGGTQGEASGALKFDQVLPPWSITVLDLELARPLRTSVGQ
jgi:Glycoside hydrolase family 44